MGRGEGGLNIDKQVCQSWIPWRGNSVDVDFCIIQELPNLTEELIKTLDCNKDHRRYSTPWKRLMVAATFSILSHFYTHSPSLPAQLTTWTPPPHPSTLILCIPPIMTNIEKHNVYLTELKTLVKLTHLVETLFYETEVSIMLANTGLDGLRLLAWTTYLKGS